MTHPYYLNPISLGPSLSPGVVGVGLGSAYEVLIRTLVESDDVFYYEHTQSTPAATWIVVHNLGKLPNVSLFNDDGVQVETDIENGINVTTFTFPTPMTGKAVFS